MPDTKTKSFAAALIDKQREPGVDEDSNKERQPGVQALTLRVKYSSGRRVEGFSWSHYAGYEWADDGDKERLTLLFGMRALTLEGYRLRGLLREIDEGRRRILNEMTETEAKLALETPEENDPIITGISVKPQFQELLKEIGGDDEHESGFARKIRR